MNDLPPAGDDDDLQRVLVAATALAGDEAKARRWLDQPLQSYDNLTPRELLERGRVEAVLKHIGQSESGSSG